MDVLVRWRWIAGGRGGLEPVNGSDGIQGAGRMNGLPHPPKINTHAHTDRGTQEKQGRWIHKRNTMNDRRPGDYTGLPTHLVCNGFFSGVVFTLSLSSC